MNGMRKIGNLLIVFGVILLVGATIWTMYNIDQDGDVGRATAQVMAQLTDEIAAREGDMPASEDDVIAMRNAGKDVIMIDGHAYIGYLTVPSQSLELPILSDWSYPNLKVSPCRYSGSVYDNGFVLAGHNYRSHFGKLNNLTLGETIMFTNVFGVVTEYTVVEMEVLRPTAVGKMQFSPYDLSLFTCNASGNARFTVRCMRAG